MKKAILLLTAVSAITAAAPAQAQIPGLLPGCFTIPCPVFDAKKYLENVTRIAQAKQKLSSVVDNLGKFTNLENTIGGIAGMPMVGSESVVGKDFDNYSMVDYGTVPEMSNNVAKAVYAGTAQGVSNDSSAQNEAVRDKITREANSNSFGVSGQSCRLAKQSIRKITELEGAVRKSTSMRSDWLANSQIRLEMTRMAAQGNYLYSTWLQQRSSELAKVADKTQPPQSTNSSYGEAAAPKPIDTAWDRAKELQDLAGRIKDLLASAGLISDAERALQNLMSASTSQATAERERDAALAELRAKAQTFVQHSGKGSATQIVNAVLAGITSYDSQMAALRQMEISALGAEFQKRDINVAEMVDANIDPRQFIGTATDPLSGKAMLDMANNLLKGSLDPMIEGDADNDAFRQAVMNYSNARLTEALLRQQAADAAPMIAQTQAIIEEQKQSTGISMTSETLNAELAKLVAQGNALVAEINKSPDPNVQKEGAAIVALIQETIAANTAARAEVVAAGEIPPDGAQVPTTTTSVPAKTSPAGSWNPTPEQ